MFRVNKVVNIKVDPINPTSVEIPILKTIEEFLGFKPFINNHGETVGGLSHVDKKELPCSKRNVRRFLIINAHTNRDK